MFKPPIRAPLRQALCLSSSSTSSCASQRCRPTSVPAAAAFVARRSTRHLTTAAPAQRARSSWKSRALRWGLAAGAVYYYNTSGVFAEGPSLSSSQPLRPLIATEPPPPPPSSAAPDADSDPSSPSRRSAPQDALLESSSAASPSPSASSSGAAAVFGSDETGEAAGGSEELSGDAQELEDEASNEGAFNPETGEINWDCPCLGGMAHGPCGAEFRAAFSCFVYSKEEPKGMDCIDKFKGMQECFQKHPDVYGTELDDDEEYARQGAASSGDVGQLPAAEAAAAVTAEGDEVNGSHSEAVTAAAAPVAHAAHERSDDGGRTAAVRVAAPDPDLALSADTASAVPAAPVAPATAAADADADAEKAAATAQEAEPDKLVPKAAHDQAR